VIALARFQVSGYLRSLRALQPLIVAFLFIVLILLQKPASAKLATGTLGDVAAFMFPLWAWAARALLDTQPDEQRSLSATAAGHRTTPAFADLLAAYVVNLALGALVIAVPTLYAFTANVSTDAILAGLALNALVAAAATVLGAWTSRAIIPDPGISLLTLLGGAAAVLLLSLGPLVWLTIPMVDWLRAAHDGPATLLTDLPTLTTHIAIWTALVATAYTLHRRTRP
jgi:hypothetical protein